MSIIYLRCAVCDEPAPARKQWWNRDTGFGVCARCFADVEKRCGEDEAKDLYGVRDLHHSLEDEG